MPQFLPQAQPVYPTNADLSKPLSLLGDTLGKAIEKRRDKQALLEVGEALQSGDTAGAIKSAIAGGRPELGVRVMGMVEQQKARAAAQQMQKMQFEATQNYRNQQLGMARQQFGLAQNADARAQAGADRAAQEQAMMMRLAGFGGGQQQSAPIGPYQNFDVSQGIPGQQATPAGAMMAAPPQQAPVQPIGGNDALERYMQIKNPAAANAMRAARESSPAYIQAEAEAKKRGIRAAELPELKLKATSELESLEGQHKVVEASLDRAIALAESGEGTGLDAGGKYLPWSTKARELSNEIETIVANLGFDKLMEIKKSGGTLGALSGTELSALQAVGGKLDQYQGEQLLKNLRALKERLPQVRNRLKSAYSREFGESYTPAPKYNWVE